MTSSQLSALLIDLLAFSRETEWLEFKHNNSNPEEIGEYLSALSNSAVLHGRDAAYMIWGIEDGTRQVIGTTFKPRLAKKGNEELESWLMRTLDPQIGFRMHEWTHDGHAMVLFEVSAAHDVPVAFKGERFIRIGSYKKTLKANRAKERALWAALSRTIFEKDIAKSDVGGDEVLNLLDFVSCFEQLEIPVSMDRGRILDKLAEEELLIPRPGGRFDITNLGAILFAKNLRRFDRLAGKALRIIKYSGDDRLEMEREWRDEPSQKGYALAYEPAVAFINSQLPHSEPIGQAYRYEVQMYPDRAIRELVANVLVHQDFSAGGSGPMVEIFSTRLEITNPGEPLVNPLRFIDATPKTRNRILAAMMRRMHICEEAGTGIDKAISAIESAHLPALDFKVPPESTRVFFFGKRNFSDLDTQDRLRACYQHACLCFVRDIRMTNTTLRERFGMKEENAAQASRLIQKALQAGLIKLFDSKARRKNASYLPFWA